MRQTIQEQRLITLEIIEENILLNYIDRLKNIRETLSLQLTLGVPIELIHIDDRIMIEKIDKYLETIK